MRPQRPLYAIYGTRAEALKIGPVIRACRDAGRQVVTIETGQHGRSLQAARDELGLGSPRAVLAGGQDIISVRSFSVWFTRAIASGLRRRGELFAEGPGTCLIQGDTPSTLIGWTLARSRRAMDVAHIESGFTSGRWWRPFPEELVRRVCTRWSDWRFTVGEGATELAGRKGGGAVVDIEHNTGVESLLRGLDEGASTGAGAAVVTVHRAETLLSPERLAFVERTMRKAAEHAPVDFVLHGPTRRRLASSGGFGRLAAIEGLSLVEFVSRHAEFVRRLSDAPFVITDSAGLQEECAWLGIPCLVLRTETEREDGLGANARLCAFDDAAVDRFLADVPRLRRPRREEAPRPSRRIVDALGLAP